MSSNRRIRGWTKHTCRRLALLVALAAIASSAQAQDVLVRGGTVLTVTNGTLEQADVLVRHGKIAAVGRDLDAPAGIRTIDATGMYVMPGIVDAHSHIGISSVNEDTAPVTPEVSVGDVLDPYDVAIYRAAAGGVTVSHVMHGSANVIGGRNEIIKQRYGVRDPDSLRMEGAPRTIKFALGENPTRVHGNRGGDGGDEALIPRTRMGVEFVMRRALSEARRYMEAWDAYRAAQVENPRAVPPAYSERLEMLADVLRGDIHIHTHSYRSDEILMALEVLEDFGIDRVVFQHVNEGFKVAPELARFGAMASVFSDWWAYKFEVYYSTAYNAAILTRNGVLTSINSDSPELNRHLYHEAAKSQRYGGLSDDEALALITINPARQLGIDERVGSIEVGKDGDLAIFDAHPLSVYAVCRKTIVDGVVRFDADEDPDDMRLLVDPDEELAYSRPSAGAHDGHSAAAYDGYSAEAYGARSLPAEAANAAIGIGVPASDTGTLRTGHEPGNAEAHEAAQPGSFALVNARIVTVTEGTIERGTVVVENGRIAAVGADVSVPDGAEIVDCEGLTIYPGFIDAGTRLGLAEVGSVSETNDYSEVGTVLPHMRALAAVNPNSVHIPVTRVSGVTTVLTVPDGGLLPGTAALIDLHGYTPDQMHAGGVEAVVLNFPVAPLMPSPDEEARRERREAYDQARKKLDEVWDAAELYARIDSAYRANPARERPPDYAPAAEALLPVLRGERPLIIRADRADTIEEALDWAAERGVIEQTILSGVDEGWRVADAIAEAGVPALVGPVLDVPARASDRYDKAYANAGLLHAAGVKIALLTNETENVRNLPYHAGFAAAYGLGREAALRAVTIDAAEIFGVADEVGSIEPGKRANLFAADGDPFEAQSRIRHLFIDGFRVSLDNRQVRLYEEFLQREP